jgi:DNA-binding ferritin-like protein
MAKTQTRKNRNRSSKKSVSSTTISPIKPKSIPGESMNSFQREIASVFFEMLLMIKLFHWKTSSYATHKATDDLYTKLNANMDSFIEVLLGKTGLRIDLMGTKSIRLIDLNSIESFKREIESFKSYLVGLNDNKAMLKMSNTDLFSIRDTILGDLNQLLYLLTFK